MQRALSSIFTGVARPAVASFAAQRSVPIAALASARSFHAAILSAAEHRIFVGGLPHEAEESDLQAVFEKYGKVSLEDTFVARDAEGRSKKFGFVGFQDSETMQSVLSEQSVEILGQSVTVNESRPREPRGERPDRSARAPRDRSAFAPTEATNHVFLGNIPFDLTETEITDAVAQYTVAGAIKSLRAPIKRDEMSEDDTRANRGFAFVEFTSVEAASDFIKNLTKGAQEGFVWPAPEGGREFTPVVNFSQGPAPRRDGGSGGSFGGGSRGPPRRDFNNRGGGGGRDNYSNDRYQRRDSRPSYGSGGGGRGGGSSYGGGNSYGGRNDGDRPHRRSFKRDSDDSY